jgi:hypothetical protein
VREQPDEPFGAVGGFARTTGRDGDGDLAQLTLDRRREPLVAATDERVEPRHRSIEAVDGRARGVAAASMPIQPDHVAHVRKRMPAL